jgi:predicted PurR-regulated permease PerM
MPKQAPLADNAPPEADPILEAKNLSNDRAPVDMKTVYLGGLFILAVLAAFYVAAAIILPVILAIVLKLVLQPVMRVLEKLYVPRPVGALIIILLLAGGFFGLGTALSAPAASWAQQLPDGIAKIESRLHTFMKPLKATQNVIQNAEGLTQTAGTKPLTVAIQGSRLSDRLLTDTQSLVSGIGETILVLFFLLASGDIFLRRFIEILPRFQDKRQAVLITQQVESDISAYLATITFMNAVVGITTGGAMASCGLADPVLWGTVAFLLNYVPILGPIIGIALFTLAGLLSQGTPSLAFLPVILYIIIHLTESMVLTPMLLAKRFTLNPVLVILGVIFWFWMWGVPGAILAMPMLAIAKIICDHIPSLVPFGHFMAGANGRDRNGVAT